MTYELAIWTVYDHPVDFPMHYVARKFIGDQPTIDTICSADLDTVRTLVRTKIEATGMTPCRLHRSEHDDPCIIETWL